MLLSAGHDWAYQFVFNFEWTKVKFASKSAKIVYVNFWYVVGSRSTIFMKFFQVLKWSVGNIPPQAHLRFHLSCDASNDLVLKVTLTSRANLFLRLTSYSIRPPDEKFSYSFFATSEKPSTIIIDKKNNFCSTQLDSRVAVFLLALRLARMDRARKMFDLGRKI